MIFANERVKEYMAISCTEIHVGSEFEDDFWSKYSCASVESAMLHTTVLAARL
jgi:hypothetical protein